MAKINERFKGLEEKIESSIEYQIASTAFNIAIKVHARLDELNMTQKDLSEKLGVSRSYVSQILNGKTNMTLATLMKLAQSLDYDLNIDFTTKAKTKLTLLQPCEEAREVAAFSDINIYNPYLGIPTAASEADLGYEYSQIANAK